MAFGVCKIVKDLTGKVIIITGANQGLGKETARALARMGGTIIIACRDITKGNEAKNEIQKETKNLNLEVLKLDLSDLLSIKEFAQEFQRKYTRLDILINNAGVMAIPERTFTKDGFEMHFGTNHLGHFYLTNILTDILKKSAPSRVVVVSALSHKHGKIHWDDLTLQKDYGGRTGYAQSKLANNLFTKELNRRLEKDGVKVVSLRPGFIRTNLQKHMIKGWAMKVLVSLTNNRVVRFWRTLEEGIQSILQCSLEDHDKLVGGAHYAECVVDKEEGKLALDRENQARLWEVSEKLIAEKINYKKYEENIMYKSIL